MFKVLEDITVATSLNPGAQLPISLTLYFGISMPVFIALHMVEHTLPIGMPRTIIKYTKVMAGIPFFVMGECVDKVGSAGSKLLKLLDAMQV